MKKLLAAIICIMVLAGCGAAEKPDVSKTDAGRQNEPAQTAVSSQPSKISFLGKFSSEGVEKILYFDDSQPPGAPADTYTAVEEIDKILEMFGGITLTGEFTYEGVPSGCVPTAAPGDYYDYEIYLKDGTVYTIWYSSYALSFDDKMYKYTGQIGRQLHIDEVTAYAECSMGYPADGKIKLTIKAFDEENTLIAEVPVLKQLIGMKYTVVKPAHPNSGKKVSVCDLPQYIDLNDYPQITTGDFYIRYHAYLPDGKEKDITAQFTIFDK